MGLPKLIEARSIPFGHIVGVDGAKENFVVIVTY